MRRAAGQVLRLARRPLARSQNRQRYASPFPSSHGLNSRWPRRDRGLHTHLLSSMHSRSLSLAIVSGLVASGAYFAFRTGNGNGFTSDFAQGKSSVAPSVFLSKSLVPSNAYHTAAPTTPTEAAIEATRRALVIDRDELYTREIAGNEPLLKSTDDYGRKVLEIMTPEQATERLRRNEESLLIGRGKGVVRYDLTTLPSNDPIEDDHAEKIIEFQPPGTDVIGNDDWMFWGVFDGHSGWTTSAKLRQQLITYVARELNSTYTSASKNITASPPLPTPSSIDAAIRRGFLALDHTIVHDSVAEVMKSKSKPIAASLLAPALSGSCALLSFYDSATKQLRVACTGDSRAILGRRSDKDPSKWVALPLSTDQTGANKEEAARLRREHPNEPEVVRVGRVLGGLEPTRAFGDAPYKWSRDTQDYLKREFFGRSLNPLIKTPPYVTAEPVVTTTEVQPNNGDFLVMATDGLWEMLTNEEVVGLVGQWLEKYPYAQKAKHGESASQKATTGNQSSWMNLWTANSKKAAKDLPVQHSEESGDQSGQRAPIRQQQWGLTENGKQSRFVVEDKNVATHLIRNALGGSDRDMVCALLTLPSPYSRRYR